jgi:hypothetical protein
MKRTTIYLPDEVHRALRREALEQDITMAEVIRRMSELYLKRDQLFWDTVEAMRARNVDLDPREVERDLLEAVRQVRRKERARRRLAR